MGMIPHSASAGERIKKAARLHGSDNEENSTS
jgi:hypothetical protein